MSDLKRWSTSDELCSLLPSTKCWWRDGYWQTRSHAAKHQRASVVIVVDWVRSNWNDITCRPWSSTRVEMLAAKADFPTPGDPLFQITLWPSVVSWPCFQSLVEWFAGCLPYRVYAEAVYSLQGFSQTIQLLLLGDCFCAFCYRKYAHSGKKKGSQTTYPEGLRHQCV